MLTTTNGVPFPENSDPISSYPATLQGMAQKVDAGGALTRYQLVAQSIPNATFTRLLFDTEPATGDLPYQGPADGITYNAGLFTITKPGLWHICASVEAQPVGNAGSWRTILRAGNFGAIGAGSANERARSTSPVVGGRQLCVMLSITVRLNLGAVFDIAAHQDSGAAVNTVASNADRATQVTAYRIAP